MMLLLSLSLLLASISFVFVCFDLRSSSILFFYSSSCTFYARYLLSFSVEVPTLDGRLLNIPIVDIIQPGYTKVVPKEGMPIVRYTEITDFLLYFTIVIIIHSNSMPRTRNSFTAQTHRVF